MNRLITLHRFSLSNPANIMYKLSTVANKDQSQKTQPKQNVQDPQNYNKLLGLIYQDIQSANRKYGEYKNVKLRFEGFVNSLSEQQKLLKYDPYNIKQQSKKLAQLMHLIAKYPKFEMDPNLIRSTYRLFCRHLNHVQDKQLNQALTFVLKVDRQAEQSVIMGQFLKFYLREKMEVIKSKYQINIRKESMGGFINKFVSSLVHRGFLRRSPDYDRTLSITYPQQTLKLMLQNKSTSENLMIRKLIYQQIFNPIVQIYQSKMHNNLYHQNSHILWDKLNENIQIVFNKQRNKLLEKQGIYLRELYVTLFLVLRQQQQIQSQQKLNQQVNKESKLKQQGQSKYKMIERHIQKIVTALDHFKTYEKQYQQSKKVKQFEQSLKQMMNKYLQASDRQILLDKLQFNHHIFSIMRQFPFFTQDLIKLISQKIVPLTFQTYFNQLYDIFDHWNQELIAKITDPNNKQNYFDLLTLESCNKLVNKLEVKHLQLYNLILQSIINKDYNPQPTIQQALTMLNIYSKHEKLGLDPSNGTNQPKNQKQQKTPENKPSEDKSQIQKEKIERINKNLRILRIFLFRYISDHKNSMSVSQLESVMKTILQLDDQDPFNDQYDSYEFNIFQQLGNLSSAQSFVVNTELKQKIADKIQNKNQYHIAKQTKIGQLLQRIKK